MRKLIVIGVLVGGLLGMAAPAKAQFNDPLTLAASGVLLPFFGDGGNLSLLEVASPAGPNLGVHMLFFNANCARQNESQGLPLTDNDIAHLNPAAIVPGVNGLIALAQVDQSGFNLVPLESPVHARVYWVTPNNRYRILEPILVNTADGISLSTWTPLRTAATFFAPPEGVSATTTLFLICPSDTISSAALTSAFPTSRFPGIVPPFQAVGATRNLRVRIYDAKETFLRDKITDCDCLTKKPVPLISNIYGLLPDAADGTYTEIESDPAKDFAFTGYRVLEGVGSTQDFHGRLSNGNRGQIQGGAFNPANGR